MGRGADVEMGWPSPALDAEFWAHTGGGAVTAAGGCTKVAQSVAQLLPLPLPPPSLPTLPTPRATAGGWGREGGVGRRSPPNAESWANTDGGAVTATEGCTRWRTPWPCC